MRSEFDRTFNAVRGVRSEVGLPNSQFAYNIPCRLVHQTMIAQLDSPHHLSAYWLTLDAVDLVTAKVVPGAAGIFTLDYFAADVVQVVGALGGNTIPCREEYIVPNEGDPYRRYLLLPLAGVVALANTSPPPPPSPPTFGDGSACPIAFGIQEDVSHLVGTSPRGYIWLYVQLTQGRGYRTRVNATPADGVYAQMWLPDCSGPYGPVLVPGDQWERTHTGPSGPYRILVHLHSNGPIYVTHSAYPPLDAP